MGLEFLRLLPTSFNEAALFRTRKVEVITDAVATTTASMRPRSFERGKAPNLVVDALESLLQ